MTNNISPIPHHRKSRVLDRSLTTDGPGPMRFSYRMAKRPDAEGVMWLFKDFRSDEHRYRTKAATDGERFGIVAACIFPTGAAYIFKLLARKMPSPHMLGYAKRNKCRVDKALREFGPENCTIRILYVGPQADYGDVEISMIELFRARGLPLYNDQPGGGGKGGWKTPSAAQTNRDRVWTRESREKIAQANRDRVWTRESREKSSLAHSGRKVSHDVVAKKFGKKPTDEGRANMRRAQRRRAHLHREPTDEGRANMRKAGLIRWERERERRARIGLPLRGPKPTDEGRANMRKAQLLRHALNPMDAETRAKIGQGNRGKKRNAQALANLRAAQKLRRARERESGVSNRHTPETIAKMRAGQKRRRERELAMAGG